MWPFGSNCSHSHLKYRLPVRDLRLLAGVGSGTLESRFLDMDVPELQCSAEQQNSLGREELEAG